MKKVVANARFSSDASGGALTYTIELGSGGDANKQLLVMVVIKQSSGANNRLYLQALHGPDGFRFTKHSDLFGTAGTPVAMNADLLMVGQTDESLMLGDYLNLALEVSDSAATSEQWILADIYTSLKPF